VKEGLFLLDGAMGTQLIANGAEPGTCNDYLNIQSPQIVEDVHRTYIEAGSDAVITNTFGANRINLARHKLDDKVAQINTEAARIARRAASGQRYVLGDIGPCGDFIEPLGTLNPEQLKEFFLEQAQALAAGGVDGFIIETMTAIEEMVIAVEATKSVGGDLPVFALMAFDKAGDDFRTMMGVDVAAAVSKVVALGVDAVGFNCGKVPLDDYIGLAERFVSAVKASGKDVAVVAEPNAGLPELVDGKAVYRVGPEDFAAVAEKIHLAGAGIIGGCCGSSPAHIKAVAERLKQG